VSEPFRALRHRNYRLWAAGAVVSNVGTWMQRTAQDWLVLTVLTHHSAVALGVVTALQFGPMLGLPLIGGALADRVAKRTVVICTQATMALLALVLALLLVTHLARLWNVMILALLLGVTAAMDGPARQSFVSEMVPPADLTSAVSLNATSFNSGRLIGPGVAGLLISGVGLAPVFFINAASFSAVLLGLWRMRVSDLYPIPRSKDFRPRVRDTAASIARRPQILVPLAIVFVIASFGLNFQVTNALMTTAVFHRGASEYGLLGSLLALGATTGAFLAARRSRPRLRTIIVAATAFGLLAAGAALLPTYWLYALALAPVGLFGTTMLTSSNQVIQLAAQPEERGRVLGFYLLTNQGGGALGAPLIGWIASVAGARTSVFLCGVMAVLVAAAGSLYLMRATATRLRVGRIPNSGWRIRLDVRRSNGPRRAAAPVTEQHV
jgi:MFS family permease